MIEAGLTKAELNLRYRAAVASLVVGVVVLVLKFYAYNRTGSQGLYSDALETIVNVLTAGLALFVVYYAARPIDDDHPYGHGKVEYFSSAFEGALIFLAAFFIVAKAIGAFFSVHHLDNLREGMGISVVAAVLNFCLGFALLFVGQKAKSIALRASGLHVLSDVWTTAGVLIGLVGVELTDWVKLDLITAILAGLFLAWTGWKLMREALGGLLDEEDIGALESLTKVFEKNASEGIIQIHHTKLIRSGWFHHIDAHVVVPEFWTVEEAHHELGRFEKAVINDYKYSGEMNFHLDPCNRKYCSVCPYEKCPVRQSQFIKRMPVLLEHLRSKTEPLPTS